MNARKHNQPDSRQREIDFSRAEQLGMLREVILPTKVVRSSVLKGVLRAIDDHAGDNGWCFATQATLARETGDDVSAKTVQRAVRVLSEDYSLLIVERRSLGDGRRTVNHYRIVWTELAVLVLRQNRKNQTDNPVCLIGENQTDNGADQTDKRGYQTDNGADQTDKRGVSNGQCCPLHISALSASKEAQTRTAPPTPRSVEAHQLANTTSRVAIATSCESLDDATSVTWGAAAEELRGCGVDFAQRGIQDAKKRGLQAADVVRACREFRQHPSRLKSPGALLIWIREGCWPADLPAPASPEAIATRAAEAAQRRRQSIEYDACQAFRRKADGESIEEYLRARDEAGSKALQGASNA